jgi:hypothetical protein
MWLGTLLMEHSEDIYRMKGLLSVQGMDERFVFQVILNSLMLFIVVVFNQAAIFSPLFSSSLVAHTRLTFTVIIHHVQVSPS